MEESAVQLYSKLDLLDKRNEFSSLLLKIDELLNLLIKSENLDVSSVVKNYDKNLNSNFSEDEMLTFFFEDLVNLKNKLLLLITLITNKK